MVVPSYLVNTERLKDRYVEMNLGVNIYVRKRRIVLVKQLKENKDIKVKKNIKKISV